MDKKIEWTASAKTFCDNYDNYDDFLNEHEDTKMCIGDYAGGIDKTIEKSVDIFFSKFRKILDENPEKNILFHGVGISDVKKFTIETEKEKFHSMYVETFKKGIEYSTKFINCLDEEDLWKLSINKPKYYIVDKGEKYFVTYNKGEYISFGDEIGDYTKVMLEKDIKFEQA